MQENPTIRIEPFDRLTVRELFAIVRLRQQVFYLEQHVSCDDWDPIDPQSICVWAACGGKTVGFLRIVPPGVVYDEASIGRVAVAPAHRRNGIARRMVGEALRYIERTWNSPVRISSQEYIIPFYEQLGFGIVSDRYIEAGIPHRKMLRK